MFLLGQSPGEVLAGAGENPVFLKALSYPGGNISWSFCLETFV